jgi:hypothetical protein
VIDDALGVSPETPGEGLQRGEPPGLRHGAPPFRRAPGPPRSGIRPDAFQLILRHIDEVDILAGLEQ